MNAIERELREATSFPPHDKLKRPKVLELLVQKVQKLSDDDWDQLSNDAQIWANAGTDALKAGKPVTDFPGALPDDKPSSKPKKAKKDASSKPKKKAKTKPVKESRPFDRRARLALPAAPSAQTLMKLMILRNLDVTTDEMMEELRTKHKLNPTKHVVNSLRGTFFHSLKVLRDQGWLKKGL